MELNQFRDMDLVIDKANDNFIQRQFVSQGDYRGRTLTVQVTDNGLIGQVPGLMLNLRWQNQASGLADLSAFDCIDAENSIFRIEYPEHMMTPGKVIANIQVIQDGKVTHLKSFELTVQNLVGEMTGIVEKAEYGALVAVLADANKFRTDIDTLETKKADKTDVNQLATDKADKTALAETDAEVAELDSSKADKTALASTNQAVNSLVSSKVDKDGNEQITMSMLSQPVKEAMTGGSVAVVGNGAVNTTNIVDDSVTTVKRTVLGESVSFTFSGGTKPKLNVTNMSFTFPNGALLLYREKAVGISNVIIDFSDVESAYVKIYFNVITSTFIAVTGSAVPADKEFNILIAAGNKTSTNWTANFDFDIEGITPLTNQNLTNQPEIQNLNAMGLAKVLSAYDLMLEQDYLTSGTGGSIYLKFSALQARNYGTKNYSWADIKTQINDETRFVAPPSEVASDYLRLGDGEALYYNKDTGAVSLKGTTTETYPQELLLAYCWRGRLRAGKFCEQLISETHKKTFDNAKDIEKIKEGNTAVPDYISAEHEAVNDEVSYQDTGDFKFIFSTDEHGNEKQFDYIKNMMMFGQVDCAVFGGDLMAASEEYNYEKARKYLSRIPRLLQSIKQPVHLTRGNHDGVSGSQDIKSQDFNKVVVNPFKSAKSDATEQVIDYPDQKIRIIMLNTAEDAQARKGLNQAQCDWFDETIKSTPAGYHVITVGHHPMHADMTASAESATDNVAGNADQILQSIQDFKTSGGIHVGHWYGHMHVDWIKKIDDINHIGCNRGAYENSNPLDGDGYTAPSKLVMTTGTVSEYSFDVVSVDTANRVVKMYRLGCGLDRIREIDY